MQYLYDVVADLKCALESFAGDVEENSERIKELDSIISDRIYVLETYDEGTDEHTSHLEDLKEYLSERRSLFDDTCDLREKLLKELDIVSDNISKALDYAEDFAGHRIEEDDIMLSAYCCYSD